LSEKCSEVLAEIEAFVDGELPADRMPDFVDHLQECPPCLHRADFQAKLKDILKKKCERGSHPPEAFVLRIRQTIRAEIRHNDEV
jgi:anti-sigma factor (TIGR02949 family)